MTEPEKRAELGRELRKREKGFKEGERTNLG